LAKCRGREGGKGRCGGRICHGSVVGMARRRVASLRII